MADNFTFTKAVRSQVPLLIGLVGPSGTGKTYSALRLARGIQRVTGGRIKGIDTEHRRMKHYADDFDFDWLDFQAPFSSLRYLDAIKSAAKDPGPIIVDSLSHEHDGAGGYLEFHEEEVKRLRGCGFNSDFAASIPAWAKPAEHRRKLIQGIIHLGATCIFCFRAKEKVDMNASKKDRNGNPTGEKTVGKLGWMPIAGDSFVFEMTLKCLLLPGADGVPTWHPDEAGEKQMCKLPGHFRPFFKDKEQLSEDIGEKLAYWASGQMKQSPVAVLVADFDRCTDRGLLPNLEQRRSDLWKNANADDKRELKAASERAVTRLAEQPADTSPPQGDRPHYDPSTDDPDAACPSCQGKGCDGCKNLGWRLPA